MNIGHEKNEGTLRFRQIELCTSELVHIGLDYIGQFFPSQKYKTIEILSYIELRIYRMHFAVRKDPIYPSSAVFSKQLNSTASGQYHARELCIHNRLHRHKKSPHLKKSQSKCPRPNIRGKADYAADPKAELALRAEVIDLESLIHESNGVSFKRIIKKLYALPSPL